MPELTIEELRALATPLARRMIEAKRLLHEAQVELLELLQTHPDVAPHGYMGVLQAAAECEAGGLGEHAAAELAARHMSLYELYCSAAAQAIPPEQQLELMLQGRFAAAVKGN